MANPYRYLTAGMYTPSDMARQAAQWQARYQGIRRIVSERGILTEEQADDVAGKPPSNFFWDTIDILSRPNFAIAGVFDHLMGKPERGEFVGSRILRELLGDTKIGTLVGIEDPTRETFGDVLEQAGLPDVKVSDVFGTTLPFKWDPGLRGTVGLGLDIFLDPTTYMGYGPAKGAWRIVTRGGNAEWVNPAVKEAVKKQYDALLASTAKSVGRGSTLRRALDAGDDAEIGKVMEEIDGRVASRRLRQIRRLLGDEGGRKRAGHTPIEKEITALQLERARLTGGLSGIVEELRARISGLKDEIKQLDTLAQTPKVLQQKSLLRKRIKDLEGQIPTRTGGGAGLVDRTKPPTTKQVRRQEEMLKEAEYPRQKKQRIKEIDARLKRLQTRKAVARERLATEQLTAPEPIQDRLWKIAERKVARGLGDPEKLAEATRGQHGITWAGKMIISDQQMAELGGPAAQAAAQLLRSSAPGRVAVEAFGSARAALHNLFNRHHFALGSENKFYAYRQDRQMSLNRIAAHDSNVANTMKELFGDYNTSAGDWHLLARALDNPTKYLDQWIAASKKINPGERYWGEDLFNHLQRLLNDAADLDVLSGQGHYKIFERLRGRYFPHHIELTQGEADRVGKVFQSMRGRVVKQDELTTPSIGRYKEKRIFDTIDEFQEFKAKLAADPNLLADSPGLREKILNAEINLDPREVIAARIRASYETYEANKFFRKVQAKYGFFNTDEWDPLVDEILGIYDLDDATIGKIVRESVDKWMSGKSVFKGDEVLEKLAPTKLKEVLRQEVDEFGVIQQIREGPKKTRIGEDLAHMTDKQYEKVQSELYDELKALGSTDSQIKAAMREQDKLRSQAKKRLAAARSEAKRESQVLAGREAKRMRERLLRQLEKAAETGDRDALLSLPKELRPFAMYQALHNATDFAGYAKVLDNIGSDLFDAMVKNPKEHNFNDLLVYLNRQGKQWSGPNGSRYVVPEGGFPVGGKKLSVMLPEPIVRDLQKMDQRFMQDENLQTLLKGWIKWTNFFKEWVTAPFPAFHFRNMYSNVAAMATRIHLAALNPTLHKQTIDIMRGIDGTLVTDNGIRYTYNQVRQLWAAHGIKTEFGKITDILPDVAARRGAVGRFHPRKFFIEKQTEIGTGIENEARALMFNRLLADGLLPAEAASTMKAFLFDYDNLSNFEKDVLRVFFPFYTWNSKNIRRQIKNLYERPGLVLAQAKPFRDRGPESDMLPEYRRGELKLNLSRQPDGSTWLFNIDLPVQNLDMIFTGNIQQTMLNMLSFTNPLLKAPLEIGFDQEVFTGRSIKGQQFMGNLGPVLEKIDKVLGGYLETEKVQLSDGSIGYKANGLKVYLLFKSWAVSRFLTDTARFDKMIQTGGVAEGLWRVMTGLDFREFDLDEEQRNMIMNRYKRLEDYLINEGYLRRVKASAPTKKGLDDVGQRVGTGR